MERKQEEEMRSISDIDFPFFDYWQETEEEKFVREVRKIIILYKVVPCDKWGREDKSTFCLFLGA